MIGGNSYKARIRLSAKGRDLDSKESSLVVEDQNT
jgi:hypothetical protein